MEKSNNQNVEEKKIANYTITDLQNDILKEVKAEIDKENIDSKGLYSRKMNIEKSIIQRVWWTLIVKFVGRFSLNIQVKKDDVVIFEYEIPKK